MGDELIIEERSSWRTISAIESNKESSDKKKKCSEIYRKSIEKEIVQICNTVLDLLNVYLIPEITTNFKESPESGNLQHLVTAKVFYLKMKADYHRYLAEVATEVAKNEAMETALAAYTEAFDLCRHGVDGKEEWALTPVDALRLGVALNFSVFYYELLGKEEEACQLASVAFDQAINELDDLSEDQYRDTSQIMQLLRDNLSSWKS